MPRTKEFDEQAVLQKALILFWRQGYHATSMDALVKDLGVNRGSLYATFGNKRALFEKAFEHYRNENKEKVEAFFKSQNSVKEGLALLFFNGAKAVFEDGMKKGCLVVNCTSEFLPNDIQMFQILSSNRKGFEQLFQDMIEKGKEKGEFKNDLDSKAIAAYLFTFFSGLNIVGKLSPEESELKAIISQGLSILV
ncbi:MAG: TetR/AcrR family transcriptional regulator [Bacteroidia bacterium]